MSEEDFQKEQQKQGQELEIYSAGIQRQFKADVDGKLAEIAKRKMSASLSTRESYRRAVLM